MLYIIKNLKDKFKNINLLVKDNLVKRNLDFRLFYLFNSMYKNFKEIDLCCIIGINLKKDMPLLLLKVRREYLSKNLSVFNFGSSEHYGLQDLCIGNNLQSLLLFLEGKHKLSYKLKKVNKPFLLIGKGILNSINSNSFTNIFLSFKLYMSKIN